MFLHQIIDSVNEGKKAKRLGWPAGHFITKMKGVTLDLDKSESKAVGLNEKAQLEIVDAWMYAESANKGIVGYELTADDRNAQDWELISK